MNNEQQFKVGDWVKLKEPHRWAPAGPIEITSIGHKWGEVWLRFNNNDSGWSADIYELQAVDDGPFKVGDFVQAAGEKGTPCGQ